VLLLSAQVTITIYDWDTLCKCKVIGSVTIAVLTENESGASWYELDSKFGQVRHEFYGRFVIEYFMSLASILIIQ